MKNHQLALGALVLLVLAGAIWFKTLPTLHARSSESLASAIKVSAPVIIPHQVTRATTTAVSTKAPKPKLTVAAKPKPKTAPAKTAKKTAGTSRLITKNAPLIDPVAAPGTR